MADVEHAGPDAEHRQVLLLISGLPAVGKSSVAAELAPRLEATRLSRDEVRRSARPVWRLVDWIAFRVLRRRLARVQHSATAGLLNNVDVELRAGRSVVVEALAEPELRREFSQLAAAATARFLVVECRCSNRFEYERRLAMRPKHWVEVVRRLAKTHEPAPDALSVDTSGSPASSADAILAVIAQ